VDGFLQGLQREHRRFSTRPLRIFIDRDEIDVMDDWRRKILGSLRDSLLFVAFLSPDYFRSRYCRWEWQAWLEHERQRFVFGEGIAPIYFKKAPRFDNKEDDDPLAGWISDLRRRNYFDLRPFVSRGVAVFEEEDLRLRLEALDHSLAERIDRVGRSIEAPGHIRRRNPRFVGRVDELAKLREMLASRRVGIVTAVQGLGGVGKTSLVEEYAHAFAGEYPGGRWELDCSGRRNLAEALASLSSQFGLELTPQELVDQNSQVARLLRELYDRSVRGAADWNSRPGRPKDVPPVVPTCLLIFDNVDAPALLDDAALATLPEAAWLHVLATTRREPSAFGGESDKRSFLRLDVLDEDSAVALIAHHQLNGNFENDAEQEAAREIVHRLDGFTLAVEAVAVYLGFHAPVPGCPSQDSGISCAAFLKRLQAEGVDAPDRIALEPGVTARITHHEKSFRATLSPTLEELRAVESYVLAIASILPADSIALPWLRIVAAERFPELGAEPPPGYPAEWVALERKLIGLRLFRASAEPHVVRMHRMVHELVTERCADVRESAFAQLLGFAEGRALAFSENPPIDGLWEYQPLVACAIQWLQDKHLRALRLADRVASLANARWHFEVLDKLARVLYQLGKKQEALLLLEEAAKKASVYEAGMEGIVFEGSTGPSKEKIIMNRYEALLNEVGLSPEERELRLRSYQKFAEDIFAKIGNSRLRSHLPSSETAVSGVPRMGLRERLRRWFRRS
jgi:TIR domain/NB-ARC domain